MGTKLERKVELEKRKTKDEKNDERRYAFFALIFLVLLFLSTFGITVSFYKGSKSSDTPNEIVTEKIVFTYSDVDRGGNGISIKNAVPISDTVGKAMIGKGEYFDFSVTATSTNANILYKVLARKDSVSTLKDSDIRIYLASTNGNYEKEVVLDTFSRLKQVTIDGTDYYLLYEKTLDKNIEKYSDFYILKMWVKEGTSDYLEKKFALKIDVIAEQVGD